MKDPYQVLGVSSSASQDDIKKAFRKLAKENHPDLHPNDKNVEKKFKEINAAYEILGDSKKRKRFDSGEIDAEGREIHPGFHGFKGHGAHDPFKSKKHEQPHESFSFGGDFDPSNFFSDLFGWSSKRKQPRPKGDDIHYTLKVSFLDAAKGVKKRITMPQGKSLDVTIPSGTKTGQILKLKGQGDPSSYGGIQGDALVEIIVLDDPYFKSEGQDIHLELPVTLQEALLGAVITIPTLHGRVNLKIPPQSNTGTKLRLKGKGISLHNITGDQIVTLKVILPPHPDKELLSFLQKWGPQNDYPVRQDLERRS